MLVVGSISGIQRYLFDIAEEGGGQAQRLRARSFYLQVLAEVASMRILHSLSWPFDSVLLSGAGNFLLRGPHSNNTEQILQQIRCDLNDWLRCETQGELRLSLAWNDAQSETESYNLAQRQLQQVKAQPWAPKVAWEPSQLILAPLRTPCNLCGHASAQAEELDRDTGQVRRVCRSCSFFRDLGRQLPRARWLVVRGTPENSDFNVLGLGVSVTDLPAPAMNSQVLAVVNLQEEGTRPAGCQARQFLRRRLMAHVPTDQHGAPVWFTELAGKAHGDALLGVLKADVDSLGLRFQHLLKESGVEAVSDLSEQLDAFFAGRLRQELSGNSNGRFRSIYTIFAGGDDLVMVGPWDTMVEFAGQMRKWFQQGFCNHALTLSAGLALLKPKRPIRYAVAEGEQLLEAAKEAGKDRLAAFGQVWPWQYHDDILRTACQLVEWVNNEQNKQMERGWLHTLLELAEMRHGTQPDPLATARFAYHVNRNYQRNEARHWAEMIIRRFDEPDHPDIRYLPAIVRYALTATRKRSEED